MTSSQLIAKRDWYADNVDAGYESSPPLRDKLLETVLKRSLRLDTSHNSKSSVWSSFCKLLENHPQRAYLLSELAGYWFHRNYLELYYAVLEEWCLKERIKHGEHPPERELQIGDRAAFIIGGGTGCPEEFIGHLATFEACIAYAIELLPKVISDCKLDWAIVVGGTYVTTHEDGSRGFIISDPKEYRAHGIEPGEYYRTRKGNNSIDMGSSWPPARHRVNCMMIYPSQEFEAMVLRSLSDPDFE
jgi:hypothetical protein